MRRRHTQYSIHTYHKSEPLWWVYRLNKFMKYKDIPKNDHGIYPYRFSNMVIVKTIKKAIKILDALCLEHPEQEITLVKSIYDRTKKWPRGKERVYIYEPVV